MPTVSSYNSSKPFSLPLFSHLYVEREVLEHPLTRAIQARLPRSVVVPIESANELTQRRSAAWSYQKRTPKLVLARNRSELLYPCSDVAPNFGHPNFYYAVPMQNCLYDCEYCYLQGMYNSAHMVLFANQDEIQQAVIARAKELGSLYLCIAYDNDLLAFEGILGVVGLWMEALSETPEVTVEVRTKSANFRALGERPVASNFILAWTLSPASIISAYEAKTPPLEARLKSMKDAIEAGWRVRLCLDPLLPIQEWRQAYQGLLSRLDQEGIWDQLQDVSYGLFRMNKDYLRKARKARPDSSLLLAAQEREERGLYTLPRSQELLKFMSAELSQRVSSQRLWQT